MILTSKRWHAILWGFACIPASGVMSERNNPPQINSPSLPQNQTGLDIGDSVVRCVSAVLSYALTLTLLSLEPAGAGGQAGNLMSLQNHVPWTTLSSSSSLFTLCFWAQHITLEPSKTKYPPSTDVLGGSVLWGLVLSACARSCFVLTHVPEPFQKKYTLNLVQSLSVSVDPTCARATASHWQ